MTEELTPREKRIIKEGFVNDYTRESVRKSLTRDANSYLDICEMLRLTYDLVYQIEDIVLKDEITEKLVDVMRVAKRMADRLTYYKLTYRDTTGSSGGNIIRFFGAAGRKRIRRSRPRL